MIQNKSFKRSLSNLVGQSIVILSLLITAFATRADFVLANTETTTMFSSTLISSLIPGWAGTTNYAFSFWIKPNGWQTGSGNPNGGKYASILKINDTSGNELPFINALPKSPNNVDSPFHIAQSGGGSSVPIFSATFFDSINYYKDGNWVFHYCSISPTSSFESIMRMDPNGTMQSYSFQRTGTFYSLSSNVVLWPGLQNALDVWNVPCTCFMYGIAFISDYYTEDLTTISSLYTSNRGNEILITTILDASNATVNYAVSFNYTTQWSNFTQLQTTSTYYNPPTAYVCSGSPIDFAIADFECHTFVARFTLYINTTSSASLFSMTAKPNSTHSSHFELLLNANLSLTIKVLGGNSVYKQFQTSTNFVDIGALNLIIIGFNKTIAKPPYTVNLFLQNTNNGQNWVAQNILAGATVSTNFYLTGFVITYCAAYEGALVSLASNLIISDFKLVCGANYGLISSSSVSGSTTSMSGSTANCQYGVLTTADFYHCLVCQQGYYENLTDGCQLSCSSTTYAMSTGSCAPVCNSSWLQQGSPYCNYRCTTDCDYGCTNICSSPCVSCQGPCNECTGCINGYYLENQTYTCQPCNATCQNCTSNLVCTICNPNFNLTNGTCNICNDGYFRTGNTCNQCNATCTLCDNLTSCTSCQPNFNLTNGSCDVCNDGYFRTGNACSQCNATCTLCDNLTSCTSCQPNFNLTTGTCEVCQSGYYRNQDSCLNCSLPCTECSESATDCTACQSPFTANNGECSGCSTGFFVSNSSGNFCSLACPDGFELDQSLSSCLPAANNTLVNNAQSIANTLSGVISATAGTISASGSAAGGFSSKLMICLVATEAIVNMQYLNIQHSKTALAYYQKLSQAFIPNWLSRLNTNDSNSTVFTWGSFQTHSVSSLYLDNYGDTLTENSMYWFLCLLMAFPTLFMSRKSKAGAFIFKLYLIFFNFAVSNILGQIQSQILFFILQVKDNFFFDAYTQLSLIIGYLTMILTIGALLYWLFQLQMIHKLKRKAHSAPPDHTEKLRSEKYEALWSDYKDGSRNRFYFTYWMVLFNAIYILLIFSTQDSPITQCSLITVWTILFVIISVIIRPFNKFSAAFMHYFNFGCIVLIEALNLYLAIMESQNPNFTGAEPQGEAIVVIIIINTSGNMLVVLIGVIHDIYHHFMKRKRGKKGAQNIIENKRKLERRLKSKEGRQTYELEMLRITQQSPLKESNHYNDDIAGNSFIILQEREGQQLNFMVEPPKLAGGRKSRKAIVEKKVLVENVGDIKLSSRARAKTNPVRTKRGLSVGQRETKSKVQGFMIDLESELENRKVNRRATFKTGELLKMQSNSNASINNLAVNSTTQRGEKMSLSRRRQTEFQLNESKRKTMNLDGHAENEMKIVEQRRTRTQKNQLKKIGWNLDTHMNSNIKAPEHRQIREQSNPPTNSNIILETQMRDNGNLQRAEIQKTQSKLTLTNFYVEFEREKKQTAERRKTQVQPNQPKISDYDAKIHIKDNPKPAERRKTQGQLTQPRINFAMDIEIQKKETAKPFVGDSRHPLPLQKPSQFADPKENMFIKYEGRRRTRALEPGYLMQ